jgi:hypothetical protein
MNELNNGFGALTEDKFGAVSMEELDQIEGGIDVQMVLSVGFLPAYAMQNAGSIRDAVAKVLASNGK